MTAAMRLVGKVVSTPGELRLAARRGPLTAAALGALLEATGLEVADRHVLDLGPGRGDALVLFQHLGARCSFVERDLAFYLLNRMHGFKGRLGDFLRQPELIGAADFVFVRGSVTDANFASEEDARTWLERLPGSVLLSPWYPSGLHLTRDLALETTIASAALACGFEPLEAIRLWNARYIYPLTLLRG